VLTLIDNGEASPGSFSRKSTKHLSGDVTCWVSPSRGQGGDREEQP
jgi:hypothetical protein